MNKHSVNSNQNSLKYIIYSLIILLVLFGLYKLLTATSIDPLIIDPNEHIKGNTSSKITLIEYSDFQCPACASYYPLVEKLMEEYKDRIQFVYRNFPLIQIHQNAYIASQAAEAAAIQGKFWEMYEKLFVEQKLWSEMINPKTRFETYAKELGLDTEKFLSDMNSDTVKEKIKNDIKSANVLRVDSTPTFVINGTVIDDNPNSYDAFKKIIDDAIANAPLDQVDDTSSEEVHLHADFKLYIDNVAYDFTQERYQTLEKPDEDLEDEEDPNDPHVHLHDKNGEMIHVHKEGIKVADFFRSIGIDFNKDCLTLDTENKYCSEGDKTLKFYVNGQLNENFGDYEVLDLDRILITYGSDDEATIQNQIASVKDEACIYSETCPERGEAPTENCIGGLGTKCK